MIIDIGDILISKIVGLPFIDKYAGVVKTLSYRGDDGKTKTFPASAQTTLVQCESGRYKDLCPDSSKYSVLYLEDRGTRFVRRQDYRNYFRASVNLVCWLNLPKLGFEGVSYSSAAIQGILSKFPASPFANGIYNQINIQIQSQEPKSSNPFQRYTYDENVSQLLMHPFDYFVLTIDIDFMVTQKCLEILERGTPIGCNTDKEIRYVSIVDRATGEVIAQVSLGQSYPVEQLTQIIQTLDDPPPSVPIVGP